MPRAVRLVVLCAGTVATLVACAGRRIDDGVFHGEGYRVSLPPGAWRVVPSSRADLYLQRDGSPGGMLAHATCDRRVSGRSFDVLSRRLLTGLRQRRVLEHTQATVNGHVAERVHFAGAGPDGDVRGEAYIVKAGGCVYDLVYVAPSAAFEGGRQDFARLVDSLTIRDGSQR